MILPKNTKKGESPSANLPFFGLPVTSGTTLPLNLLKNGKTHGVSSESTSWKIDCIDQRPGIRLLLVLSFVISYAVPYAQTDSDTVEADQKDKVKVSGSADVYYRFQPVQTDGATATSFTGTQNRFTPGMASVKFQYSTRKLDLVADLGFGPRVREYTYNETGISQAIKQVYLSFSPIKSLKLTAGTFATHLGYEVLDPQLNRNYSMSYLFSRSPFFHTGIKAEYGSERQGLMLGVANPSDYIVVPENHLNKKTLLAQYRFTPSQRFKLYLNYAGGKAPDTVRSDQFDLAGSVTVNPRFSLGFSGAYAIIKEWDVQLHQNLKGKSWWSGVLYFNYDFAEWAGLTWRSEWFNDHLHLKSINGKEEADRVFANTLSANFRSGHFTLIPEIRYDHSRSGKSLYDLHLQSLPGDLSFLLAAICYF